MNFAYCRRLLLLVIGLSLSSCVHSPRYSSAPWLLEATLDASDSRDISPFADIRVATEDGAAEYRFRFFEVEADGPSITLIETPLGYATPDIPSECALSTFLRVAAVDAEVPRQLLEECGVPGQDGEPHSPVAEDPSFRVSDLRTPDHTLPLTRSAQRCSRSAFDGRLGELEELASYQPNVITNCQSTCELFVAWNSSGCAFYDGDGRLQNNCSPTDFQALILQYGPSGMVCLEFGQPDCDLVPNPACAHTEWVIGDWGPYSNWTRNSAHTGRTTRVRTEITTCCGTPTQGWWQFKRRGSDPWGTKYGVTFGQNTTSTLILSAGWDGNSNWRGWDFRIHAEGQCFHAATAWVELQGRSRFTCPLKI